MWRGFWKGSLVSLGAYAAALGIGVAVGLWFTLAAVPVFQGVWALFCVFRILQLRRDDCERESYGFAVGGLASSFLLLLATVVASQAITA